jgi:hypothetical protein
MRVSVVHSGLPDSERPRHVLGWRHYFERLQLVAQGQDPGAHAVPRALMKGADERRRRVR